MKVRALVALVTEVDVPDDWATHFNYKRDCIASAVVSGRHEAIDIACIDFDIDAEALAVRTQEFTDLVNGR